MILKKPYGFIIKHFKLINIILLIPTVFVTLSFSDISKFLNHFVSNKYTTFEVGIAGKYINLWLLITLVFLILFNIVLYDLMRKKKKSTRLYEFSIIFYFVLFILSLLLYNLLTNVELGRLSTTAIGIYRDILMFIPLIGYFLIIATLFKGIGFNIKTLKFDKTIDLQLTDEDTEEFEIAGRADQADFKKIGIHIFRELKYYIIENKFVVICITILALLIITSNIYINIGFYNKKYASNENLALNNMIFSVKDSYITNVDQGGNQIAHKKYYLVVKLGIENINDTATSIQLKDFRIDVNKKHLYPALDQGNKFLDIANNYEGKSIPPKIMPALDNPKYICEEGYTIIGNMCSNKKDKVEPELEHQYYCPDGYELKSETCELPEANSDYVIVYEIKKEEIKRTYVMKILNKTTNDIGELNPSYKMIKFKPKNLLNKVDLGTIELGEEMNLKDTLLGETKVKVNKVNILTSYNYEYTYCITKKDCEIKHDVVTAKSGKLLVVVDDVIKYDKDSAFYKYTNHEFYKYFGKITYKYKDEEYTDLMKDITPKKLKNKRVYEISSIAKFATNKKLIITIRNKYYSINFE